MAVMPQAAPLAMPPVPVAPAPIAEAAVVPVEAAATPATETAGDTIKSPIIGTFYRKPAPDKPNFVEVGDRVNEGDTLCVIEAMKLFNEIEAEMSGTIVKILVEDSTPVEFDQPLFVIDPA
jgi:acetyl-CoA carboxylase biotin carboxyl carrier protein